MAIKTSPCPLQRGIGSYCPPSEGVGGGENAFVIGRRNDEAIQK